MGEWWRAEGALWSHRNTQVVRRDNQPISLLLSFTHEQYVRTIGRTVDIAKEILRSDAFAHMMEAFRWFRAIVIEIPDDASYVNQLAVLSKYRGNGIGKAMLKGEFLRSQLRGLKAVELDVNDNNSRARRLYEGLGMYVFSTVSAPTLRQHGFETHHRMRIDL